MHSKKQLGFWDSVAINIGIIIGVGIFRAPGEVARYLDSPNWILLAWVLGGIVALFGVFCYAGLSSRYPETGGTYIYLREAYGRGVSFLFGWIEFSIIRAGSIAAVSYIFTTYLGNFFPFTEETQRWVTVGVVVIFTAFNVIGLRTGANIQNSLSLLKIVAIFFIASAIFAVIKNPPAQTGEVVSRGMGNLAGIAPALIPILWSYGGWHQSTYLSGEFRDTKKALPLSLIASIGAVAAIYFLMNAAYLRALSPGEMLEAKTIASDIFGNLFGPQGQILITIAVLISASGALNSTILTGGRIPFAVARDYPRLSWLAKVDRRFDTPIHSIVITSVWASVLVLWGNFEQLLFFYAFANWLVFALIGISVFILKKRDGSLSVTGYPVIPILFIASCVWICITTIQHAPQAALFWSTPDADRLTCLLVRKSRRQEARA